jgi:hypothetical protein
MNAVPVLAKIRDHGRYCASVARFLRTRVSADAARQRILDQLARRESAFLDVLERGIYANPRSPYHRLLNHAGITLDRVSHMVAEAGLEPTLSRLYDDGIFLTVEEARGRTPVRRGGFEFTVRDADLDNPLLESYYEGISSGSRTPGRRVFIEFGRLEYEACLMSQLFAAHGLTDRPLAVWRPTPPDTTAINNLFRYTRIGAPLERWFSQASASPTELGRGPALMLYSTLFTGRLVGRSLPFPRFVPRRQAIDVARWLAHVKAQGTPGCVDTSASGATRVCLSALERGLDIRGSAFVVGGEPYTSAKAAAVERAGARAVGRYSLSEVGAAGFACANPLTIDDMHVAVDKVAVIQRNKVVSASGESVSALVFSTLLATSPTVMLNTESGDYGELADRECGCPLGSLGFKTHLTSLRSYEKLTSEGVSFMRHELYALLEEVLPARFGGHPTDYQLVEEEIGGLPKASLIVSPDVGAIDERALTATVLETLDKYFAGGPAMANEWRRGETLRVLRREPFASGSRKILPLVVLRGSAKADQTGRQGDDR